MTVSEKRNWIEIGLKETRVKTFSGTRTGGKTKTGRVGSDSFLRTNLVKPLLEDGNYGLVLEIGSENYRFRNQTEIVIKRILSKRS